LVDVDLGDGTVVGGAFVVGGFVVGGGEVVGTTDGLGEVAGTKPVPVTVTDVPGAPCVGFSVIVGWPDTTVTSVAVCAETGGDRGAATMFVSMVKGAVAQRSELAPAHARTVIVSEHTEPDA
jgi:hypothetical protein